MRCQISTSPPCFRPRQLNAYKHKQNPPFKPDFLHSLPGSRPFDMNLNMSNIFNDGRGTSYNHASLARLEGALDLILEHVLQAKRLPEAETHETRFSVSIGHLPSEVLGMVFVLCNETREENPSTDQSLPSVEGCRIRNARALESHHSWAWSCI